MTRRADLSIVIPVHNGADFIAAAVATAVAQPVSALQVVVVDDASTDATRAVIDGIAREHPHRVEIVALGERGGPAGARRAGFAAATGRYIWFVDADDRAHPEAAPRMLSAADREDADVVIARARSLGADGSIRDLPTPPPGTAHGADILRSLLRGHTRGHLWNKLFRRAVIEQVEFTPTPVHSDLAIVAQALALADVAIATDDLVYDYVIRPGSVITTPRARAASLTAVEDVVARAAADRSLIDTSEYAAFVQRTFVLSALKDATRGPYTATERAELLALARRRITGTGIRATLALGDIPRAAALIASKASRHGYRLVDRFV